MGEHRHVIARNVHSQRTRLMNNIQRKVLAHTKDGSVHRTIRSGCHSGALLEIRNGTIFPSIFYCFSVFCTSYGIFPAHEPVASRRILLATALHAQTTLSACASGTRDLNSASHAITTCSTAIPPWSSSGIRTAAESTYGFVQL